MKLFEKNYLFYWISLIIILLTLFRSSFLPGAKLVAGKEPYLIVLCGYVILIFILDAEGIKRLFQFNLFNKENLIYLILLALVFISILFNVKEISSVQNILTLIGFASYILIFFFLLPTIFMKDYQLLFKFLVFFSTAGLVVALVGLYLFYTNTGFDPVYAGTVSSFIEQPNYVSFLFTNTCLITLYLFLRSMGSLSFATRVFYFISFSIQIVAQFFTFSRAGLIGTSMGAVILFLYYFRKKAFLIFPIIVLLTSSLFVRFFSAKGFASFNSRFALLLPAYYMMRDSPQNFIWGYGISTYKEVFKQYILLYIPFQPVENPHNSIVSLILGFGIIFTLVLLIFTFSIIVKAALKSFAESSFDTKLFIGFLIAVSVGMIIHGLFDSALTYLILFELQFLLLYLGLLRLFNQRRYLHYKFSI